MTTLTTILSGDGAACCHSACGHACTDIATLRWRIKHRDRGPLNTRLQQEIVYLAEAYGGPVFQPHVTLIPGFEADSDADAVHAGKRVAKALKQFRIHFDQPAYGGMFHQCVYILCKPTEEVIAANKVAKEQLRLSQSTAYIPHLSLLYSHLDERIRRSVVELEKRRLFEGAEDMDLGFDADCLAVWSTDPADTSLKSWKLLADFCISEG